MSSSLVTLIIEILEKYGFYALIIGALIYIVILMQRSLHNSLDTISNNNKAIEDLVITVNLFMRQVTYLLNGCILYDSDNVQKAKKMLSCIEMNDKEKREG